jgi:hypothetical protein
MRALLAALLLSAAAAITLVPSASAAAPDPVCVPPDPFQLGVCAGSFGSYFCVLARVGPPVHGVCVDPTQPDAYVCLFDECFP